MKEALYTTYEKKTSKKIPENGPAFCRPEKHKVVFCSEKMFCQGRHNFEIDEILLQCSFVDSKRLRQLETHVRPAGKWTGKKTTNVIDRCEVNESFVEGCLQTVLHNDKHLLGVFRARLVFAADFFREPEMQIVAALCMNFEKRKFAVKPLYCFVQITQQLLSSLEQHTLLV